MNILFDSRAGILELFIRLNKKITNNLEFKPFSVVHNKIESKRAKELGVEPVYILSDFLKDNWNHFDISKKNISMIEEKYLNKAFHYIISIDPFLNNLPYQIWIKKQFVGYFEFYKKIFDELKIEIFVSEVVVGLWNYIPYLLSKHYNIRYMGFMGIRIDDRFNFICDEFNTVVDLKDIYLSMGIANKSIDAQRIIERIVNQKKQPFYTINYINNEIMKRKSLIYSLKNVFSVITSEILEKDMYDYKLDGKVINYQREFIFRIKKKILEYFKKSLWSIPIAGEEYCIYSLHYEPEASTLVDGQFFCNQIETIKKIAKVLPFKYKLYVKEHVASYGRRQFGFYKELKKIPNVVLLSPFCNIYDLIKHSKIIFTITGTIALEAIFYKKPVILFGNTFFDFYKYIFKVTDFTLLESTINKILAQYEIIINDNESMMIFLEALLKRSYPGYSSTSDMEGIVKENNLDLIYNGLISEIFYQNES